MDWEKTWIEEKRRDAEKEEGEGDLEKGGKHGARENRAGRSGARRK